MPFNRSYNRRPYRRMPVRGRRRRRRTYARRPMTSGRIRRIIDAELKFIDLDFEASVPSSTGSVTHISNMAQGDTASQRQGNWIKPVKWMGNFTVSGNAGSSEDTSQFRLMVVCWKENEAINGLTAAKILQDTNAPHQGYNIQNKGQFKILWSRIGIVSNNSDNPQFQKLYRFYVSPPMKVLYDGAAFRNNQLFVVAVSDQALDSPAMVVSSRLRYTDS